MRWHMEQFKEELEPICEYFRKADVKLAEKTTVNTIRINFHIKKFPSLDGL